MSHALREKHVNTNDNNREINKHILCLKFLLFFLTNYFRKSVFMRSSHNVCYPVFKIRIYKIKISMMDNENDYNSQFYRRKNQTRSAKGQLRKM